MDAPPRIAIVGCGALGSYYGACLLLAGAEVHFLLRSDFDAVRQEGVTVRSAAGDFTVRPHAARTPAEIGPVDWVVIGLKTTANGEFDRLVRPLVGGETALLTLQNGLGNEAALAALFGAERVLGGLCFVCLNRWSPGVIHHLAHGRIVMGEWGRPAGDRARHIAGWFQRGGVPCEVTDDLEKAHWQKLVWNIPFNGLGVASSAGWESATSGRVDPRQPLGACLATDQLLGAPTWAGLVRELMAETMAASAALGMPLPADEADAQIARTREMGSYRASTLIDFERGSPLEVESLFGEPLRQARAAGVSTPRLAALYDVVRALDGRRPPAQ